MALDFGENCYTSCRYDGDCPGNQKCCADRNSCSRCVEPGRQTEVEVRKLSYFVLSDLKGLGGRVVPTSDHITKTCLYNVDPLKPHLYIIKLGFTGVYIIFLISAQKHRLWVLIRTTLPRRF